mmetsp:Transcript_13344/g.30989  ORF Transcript_13344/g.30989 Transcript_13344/m.30989 type:complete len:238 (+) Transcript_13344:760-1473(+)
MQPHHRLVALLPSGGPDPELDPLRILLRREVLRQVVRADGVDVEGSVFALELRFVYPRCMFHRGAEPGFPLLALHGSSDPLSVDLQVLPHFLLSDLDELQHHREHLLRRRAPLEVSLHLDHLLSLSAAAHPREEVSRHVQHPLADHPRLALANDLVQFDIQDAGSLRHLDLHLGDKLGGAARRTRDRVCPLPPCAHREGEDDAAAVVQAISLQVLHLHVQHHRRHLPSPFPFRGHSF